MSRATSGENGGTHIGRDANTDDLQTSNLTSGHFLGIVPRRWMSGGKNTLTPGYLDSIARRSQRPRLGATDAVPVVAASSLPLTAGEGSTLNDSKGPLCPESPSSSRLTQLDGGSSSNIWTTPEALTPSRQAASRYHTSNRPPTFASLPEVVQLVNGPASSPVRNNLSSGCDQGLSPATLSPALPVTISGEAIHSRTHQAKHHHLSAPATVDDRLHASTITPGTGAIHNAYPQSLYNAPPTQTSSVPATTRPPTSTDPSVNLQSEHLNSTDASMSVGPGIPSWASPNLPAQLQTLDRLLASVAERRALTSPELVRVTWLRAACEHGDMLFLLLHQLTCVNTVYPQFLQPRLAFAPFHLQGLTLLGNILGKNALIPPDMMLVFCNYVRPVGTLATDENVQSWLPSAKEVLARFITHWEMLRIKVFNRGYLPSADEFAEELGLDAFVLSQAVFLNFYTQMYPQTSSNFMQDAFSLFKTSQNAFYDRRSAGSPADDRARHQHAYATTFGEIVSKHRLRPQPTFQPLVSFLYNHPQPATSNFASPSQHSPRQAFLSSARVGVQNTATIPAQQAHTRSSTSLTGPSPNTSFTRTDTVKQTTCLLPRPGQLLPITVNPKASRIALHQALLSDPTIELEESLRQSSDDMRLYSFTEHILGRSKEFDRDTVYETWSFSVSLDLFKQRAYANTGSASNPLGRTTRIVRNGAILVHLRCIEAPAGTQSPNPAVGGIATTVWPEHLCLSLNETPLDFRRKRHHGRDLPIDITSMIREGKNEIEMSHNATKIEKDKPFEVIVEAVNVLDHSSVRLLPGSMDAQTSLAMITDSMRTNIDDDDLVMADAHVSIDLIDPFTARIFDQPVRGKTCRHRECFDLEAFLQSRSCRNKDNFVQPDEWRCPMCGRDARPTSLVIDQFLLKVKEQLVAGGQSDTRAILVRDDGSWHAKDDHVRASTSSRNVTPANAPAARSSSAATKADANAIRHNHNHADAVTSATNDTEIIVLDDDDD